MSLFSGMSFKGLEEKIRNFSSAVKGLSFATAGLAILLAGGTETANAQTRSTIDDDINNQDAGAITVTNMFNSDQQIEEDSNTVDLTQEFSRRPSVLRDSETNLNIGLTPRNGANSNIYTPDAISVHAGLGFELGVLPGVNNVNLSEFSERRNGARHQKLEASLKLSVRGGYEKFGKFSFGVFASKGNVIPSDIQQSILKNDDFGVTEVGGTIEAELGTGSGFFFGGGVEAKRVIFDDLGEQNVLDGSIKLGIHSISEHGEGSLYLFGESTLLAQNSFENVTLDGTRTLFIRDVPVFEFEAPTPSDAVDALPVNRPGEFSKLGIGLQIQFNKVGGKLEAYGVPKLWFGEFGDDDTRSADNQGGITFGLTYKIGG